MYPANTRLAFGAAARRGWLLILLLAGAATGSLARAAGPFTSPHVVLRVDGVVVIGDSLLSKEAGPHMNRALAAALAVTLGPFGAHRLYLGTRPKVPLIYGLTFGGFGVLVLIDLGHILFTRDLSVYQNNDQVLMWAKSREEGVTPP